ncbi:MAG: beta-hexosaminidase [Cyclobacteriaceae bacterium]|nr:MAG: beta-hexosaminidase [Cyclobacteriaceae bacterium]
MFLVRISAISVLWLTIFGCTPVVKEAPEIAPVAIIPLPLSVTEDSGYFIIDASTIISVESKVQAEVANLFVAEFHEVSGWAPVVKQAAETAQIKLANVPGIPNEGYHLEITEKAISIRASTDAGFFYALQTLKQLLPPSFVSGQVRPRKEWAIPVVTIVDAPAFGWRGFMLDVSRHFFDKLQVKQVLDLMAGLKINRFHWHLTDDQGWRIEIKSYPKLTEAGAWRVDYTNYDENVSDWWGRPEQKPGDQATYGGYYTQDDIKEIVEYARVRFIEVIPEIDMPGHAQATIAAYPEIGCVNAAPYVATGGVFRNNTYNPGKEETFQFIETMLGEVMDLFPFEYIHIGGDECNKEQWKVDPHAQQRIRDEGLKDENELQSYFIKRVEEIINNGGRKLIGWDEILEGGLAPNATVMSWRGEEGGIAAAQAGHDVIMTPSKFCYIDLKQGPDDLEPNLGYSRMLLKDAYQYNLIPDSFSKEQAGHILGTQANLWTESISDWGKLTYMTFPRVYAIAENGWTPENLQDWNNFTDRLYPHLERLEIQEIRYATSAFNVNILHQGTEQGIEFSLDTEVNGLDYYYTLDGADPDTTSTLYSKPFIATAGVTLSARAFKNARPLGKTSRLSFPIHLGKGSEITYLTPYLKYKDAAGKNALVDYNYAGLTIADDNWQGFGGDMIVIMDLGEAKSVSGIQMTNLRFTISGVYVPAAHQVHGSVDGKDYQVLGKTDQSTESLVQGRNKVTSNIDFETQNVRYLKIVSEALNPIPAGHHLAGQSSKIYIDEIVVK